MKVLQVVGYKNAGKTTLLCEIVSALSAKGLRVGTIKRDAHDCDPDTPGTDTWRHRQAGAKTTALIAESRTMWISERPASLSQMLSALQAEGTDIAVVEGFKTETYPKIVLVRGEEDADLLRLSDIVCIAAQAHLPALKPALAHIPMFRTTNGHFAPLLDFVEKWLLLS